MQPRVNTFQGSNLYVYYYLLCVHSSDVNLLCVHCSVVNLLCVHCAVVNLLCVHCSVVNLLCVHCSVVNLLCVHCSVVNFEHVIAHGGYPVKMSDIYAILCVTRNCDIVTGVFC